MARSSDKGPFVDDHLQKKIDNAGGGKIKDAIKTWSRRSMITPDFVGKIFDVHDGKKFVKVHVTESMVGHKLGEFAPTRIFRMHSGQRKAGAAPAATT